MNPLVSIIIPSFNCVKYIKFTLDCVLKQTYNNWECIIIDDYSTDNSTDVIQEIILNDDRFKLIKKAKEKKGASSSRNLGLDNARGKYIQFLDSDDLISKNKLENQVLLLEEVNCNFCISTCKWKKFSSINGLNEKFSCKSEYRDFKSINEYFELVGRAGGYFPIHSFLINRELIKRAGYWNEGLSLNDDGEFMFRVLINSESIYFEENSHVLYRDNLFSLSKLSSKKKSISLVNSWKIIEALYFAKYNVPKSEFLNFKKEAIYKEIKGKYPKVIKMNKAFFIREIKKDNLFRQSSLFFRKVKNKIKSFRKNNV